MKCFSPKSPTLFLVSIVFYLNILHPAACNAQNNRIWGTYYGGSNGENGAGITTDPSGNVYLVGTTSSLSGIASGGFQNIYGGGGTNDAFLVKFDAGGNRLWATYYGGTESEDGMSIITDASGNIYMAGSTSSTVSIASNGFQNTYGGDISDAFLVKFDADGNRLWATYYGGDYVDYGFCIATDGSGNVYLSGQTGSSSGIASGGFQNVLEGPTDAFLVKFDAAGNRLWGTYYGGTGNEDGRSIVTDGSYNVYLSGYTGSSSGIASGGFQNTYGGSGTDAFLVKFDTDGNRLWATYYGGTSADVGFCVAIDGSDNIYLSGQTQSTTGIASGGFQNVFGGTWDAFLVKFDAGGNRFWSTYYGGTGNENGRSIATDGSDNVYLSGQTQSTTGIASGGFQNIFGGTQDAFLAKFSASGTFISATYYGGTGSEDGINIACNSDNVYLSGQTQSAAGIASGGFQNVDGGGSSSDAFLVKFTSAITSLITGTVSYSGGLITNGYAKLYSYSSGSRMILKDSVAITNGSFIFNSITPDTLIVYAKADIAVSSYSLTVGTFYRSPNNTIYWDSAYRFIVEWDQIYSVPITLYETPPLTGNGEVSGIILEGDSFQKTGDPISDIAVSVSKKPSGAIIANTQTDSDGRYHFQNLEQGTYTIYANIPGLPMADTYTIIVTPNDTIFTDRDFIADSAHIYIAATSTIVAVPTQVFGENIALKIFPNPYIGSTTLQYSLKEKNDVTLEVFTIVGEKIVDYKYSNQQPGVHTIKFSGVEKGYSPGIYLVRFQVGSKTLISRISEIKH